MVPLTWQELRLAAEEGFGELLRQQEEEGGQWMEEGRARGRNHPPYRARPLPTGMCCDMDCEAHTGRLTVCKVMEVMQTSDHQAVAC